MYSFPYQIVTTGHSRKWTAVRPVVAPHQAAAGHQAQV